MMPIARDTTAQTARIIKVKSWVASHTKLQKPFGGFSIYVFVLKMSRRILSSRSSQVWRPCSCDVLSLSKRLSMPPWSSRASKSLSLTRVESCSASMPKPFSFAFSSVEPCVSSVGPNFSRWTISSASDKIKIGCRRKAKKKGSRKSYLRSS